MDVQIVMGWDLGSGDKSAIAIQLADGRVTGFDGTE